MCRVIVMVCRRRTWCKCAYGLKYAQCFPDIALHGVIGRSFGCPQANPQPQERVSQGVEMDCQRHMIKGVIYNETIVILLNQLSHAVKLAGNNGKTMGQRLQCGIAERVVKGGEDKQVAPLIK